MPTHAPPTSLPPLRAIRAEAFQRELKRRGKLLLDETEYGWWREDGWNRTAVDRAVEDCVILGKARLECSRQLVTVHPVAEEQER
jgi:hypothetical protein